MRATAALRQNHYQILGLKVNASAKQIKKRFYQLSKEYHPDANKTADPAKYQEITQAYTVLSNEQKRREFDQTLGQAVRQPQGYTSRRSSWQGTARAQSGYKFHDKWAARAAHATRRDPTLDPLKPNQKTGPNDVPHFDHKRHFAKGQRQDEFRERPRGSADTAGSARPPPQSGGLGYIFGGVAGSLCLGYLLVR